MKSDSFIQPWLQRVRQRPVLAGVLGLVVAGVLVWAFWPRSARQAVSYFEVKRGDFLISIVEGGTVEAVNEVVVRNEVEGTARIIYIVPEGSYVRKGQLLVELDSSASLDSVNQQQINVERAQFALIQAEQQLDIQKSSVESELSAARLKVEFAETDLKKYLEGEAAQARRNAQIEITNVVESLQINVERLEWTEKLYAQGYETKANLDRDRLAVSQARLRLEQAEKSLWMLETFDAPKRERSLESALQEAKDDYDRVKLQGERKLAQAEADVQTQRRTLELSQTKLERDRKQLEATKILAPQDGLVVYASGAGSRFSSESLIEEGAVVRNRQELIKLPDVSEMKLQVKIHESHVNQIRSGQPAFVVLDSMPDQRFRGFVAKVAPLPDSQSRWGNPNLKVYATEVRITDRLPDVKPGVSARAEIIITNLAGVLTVPIQSVTTLRGQQVAYLLGHPPKPVPVSVGMYNQRFIEITSGLSEGDRVLLSPPFDIQEKDLGGALVNQGDELPVVDSNQVARALQPRNGGDRNSAGLPAARESGSAGPENRPRERRLESGDPASASGGGEPPRAGRAEGERRGNFPSREELLKQFDTNGDGVLDETERAAMRARFGGQRRPGTNAPPANLPQPAPGS
ncbi:MAG: efflux RND transporter periplasmic adaptor subunit [Verrucomicrobia bacterium]|nr:efflux RND transporter periplasmic adaptor subunit [Verrucomicrobiota bacterium]